MLQDIRYAVRTLRQNCSTTILAILAIALGIGANAAIFTVADAVLLRPLPYKDPDRLIFVRTDLHGEIGHAGVASGEIQDIRDQSRLVEAIGWMVTPTASLTGDGQMERVTAATASDEFLPVLGAQPLLGRGLHAAEDIGKDHVEHLLISYELWDRRYHRDPNIIGRPIEVNNFVATVAGVMPKGFRAYMGSDTSVPPRIDIWFPAGDDARSNRSYHYYQTVARLRIGVTVDQAQAEIDAIAARMIRQNPKDYPDGDFRIRIVPLLQDVVKPVRTPILVLLGAVGFVLLIACANVANLFLARASGRKKEIAIRAALGAGRIRVIRQLLTESILLALLGGTTGLLLAQQGVRFLLLLRPENLPRQDDIVLNATVTAFAFLLSLFSGVLFGLAPALHAARADVNSALKESVRSVTSGAGGLRLRAALVTTQVALSLVLLIGAGLMIRTFQNMQRVELGFDPASVLTFKVGLNGWEFRGGERMWRFYQRAVEAVRAQPGVESVSGIGRLPLDNEGDLPDLYALPQSPDKLENAEYSPVLPGYFKTMRLPVVAGRDFTDKDNDDGASVAIVDEQFAKRTWPGESGIGKTIILLAQSKSARQVAEVVGIVRHVQFRDLRRDDVPQIYMPYRNNPTYVTMVVRARTDPMNLAVPLRRLVEGLGGQRPVFNIRPMDEYVSATMAETRFALILLGLMSAVAFLLSVIGIYGVVSYSVVERMTEFAIRLALGAQSRDILKLALGWGIAPAAAGVAIGIVAASGLTRFISALLFGVSNTDVMTYVWISGLLLLAAGLASYIPVRRRALKADPRTFLE